MKLKYAFEKELCGFSDDPGRSLGPKWQKIVFESLCNIVIESVFSRLSGANSRAYYRICSALDATTEQTIELDKADLEFLKNLFFHDNASVPPQQNRLFNRIKDEIETSLKEQG